MSHYLIELFFFFFGHYQEKEMDPRLVKYFPLFFSPIPSFYSLFIFQSDVSRESDSPAWKTHLESIGLCLAPSPSPHRCSSLEWREEDGVTPL